MTEKQKKKRKTALDRIWFIWRPTHEQSEIPSNIEKLPFRGRLISDYTTKELEKLAKQ